MKEFKVIPDHHFIFEDEHPKNIYGCHFFKTFRDDVLGTKIEKNEAYCSLKNEILNDYNICIKKHCINFKHPGCQSFLEKLGNMDEKSRLELRNLQLIKDSLRQTNKSISISRWMLLVAVFALFVAIAGPILSYYLFVEQPKRDKQIKIEEQIKYVYRNINANEDIFISNINDLRNFKSNTQIDNLPFNFLELDLTPDIHDELQRKIGLINYRFLLYYSENTNSLNILINRIKNGFYSKNISPKDKDIYSDLMDMLSKEGWKDTKFNYQMDAGCLLKILQESFPYIVDDRNKQMECNHDSLNRIYYYFGYLEVETPLWMKMELKDALKERGTDAWWIE